MDNDEFQEKVIAFIARTDEHIANQNKRCDSHAKSIKDNTERILSLESTREYGKGVLKAVGVGVPAVGSLAWFFYEAGKLFIKAGRQ